MRHFPQAVLGLALRVRVRAVAGRLVLLAGLPQRPPTGLTSTEVSAVALTAIASGTQEEELAARWPAARHEAERVCTRCTSAFL